MGASLLSAVLAMVAVVSHAGTNSWTIKGPPGGHVLGVKAHSTAPNVFYAMFARSIHRSTDGGVTWTVVRNFEGQVNGLAIDPSNGDRLYVSVYDEGLYRSENRGDTFTIVDPPGIGIWGVATSATTVYYAGADRRIHRSVDRGNNWTIRGTAQQTLTKLVVDPQNADLIYGINGPYVLASTNGGTTWTQTQVTPSFTTIRDIAQLSTTQFVAAADGGIYASSDSGATWGSVFAGDFISLAADPTTPGRAVASRWSSGALIETTNYGASWHTFGASSEGRSEGVAFDSQASTRIVLVGPQFARYSTNAAQAWVDATQPPIAQEVNQFATTLASNSKVYAYASTVRVGGSALFVTSGDSGWQRLTLPGAGAESGQSTIAVRPGAPNRLYFVPFGQGIYRSSDGGVTWLAPGGNFNGASTQSIAFAPDAPDTLYASIFQLSSPGASGIFRSTDDGATWAPLSTNLNTTVYGVDMQIDPANPSRMFLAAAQFGLPNTGGLYRSTDRGVTWNQAFVGQDTRQVAIDPANSSRVYSIAAAALQVSDDGGDTFTASSSFAATANQSAQSVALDPVVPTTVYATSTSSSSYVLRSVNSGQTWEVLRAGTEPGPWRATRLALDPNTPSLLYVGVSGQGVATFEVAPDLHLNISGHSGTRPRGFESTFNLRAVNNGPYAATRVNVSATLPAGVTNINYSGDRGTCSTTGCIVPVLQVGEEINAVVRYTTPANALFLPVTATVSGHENDGAAADNTVQASAITGDPGDLSVTVVPSVTTLTQGGNVTYTVTVTNRGPTASNDGNVTFNLAPGFTLGTLPSSCAASPGGGFCALGTIAVGGSQAFTFSAVATNAGAVNASATVTTRSDIADTNLADNSATSSVTATVPPPPTPPSGGNNGGGGGGGSMNPVTLLGALLLLAGRRRSDKALF